MAPSPQRRPFSLTVLVIAFGPAGIHFLGDPLRDQVFRVVFIICDRIYDTIADLFFW